MPTGNNAAAVMTPGPVVAPDVPPPSVTFPSITVSPTNSPLPTSPGQIIPTIGPVIAEGNPSPSPVALPESPTPVPTLPAVATPSGPLPTFGPVLGPDYTPPPTATVVLPPPVTPGPSLTPGPMLRADLMGVQMHGFLTDDEFSAMLDRAAELGMTWIKLQIDWALYEPNRGEVTTAYAGMVLNVQRTRIRGFRTLLTIARTPDWARPPDARERESGPPADPQDLAVFVARLVRDIKPEFIDAIEVWNEPNLIREWRGASITGAEYMRYFRAAYDAILREQRLQRSPLRPDHRIMVITAGPAPTVTLGDGSTLGDREWLQGLYDAGLGAYGLDVAVGAHPYGWANAPEARCCTAGPGVIGWFEHPSFYFRETLDAYRAIMTRNQDTARKIWVTEFGWAAFDGLLRSDGSQAAPAADVGWSGLLTQRQQAEYVLRAFRLAQQPPYYEFLGPMFLWNLNYALVPGLIDGGQGEAAFSLLDGEGEPRPVFIRLRDAPKITPGQPPG